MQQAADLEVVKTENRINGLSLYIYSTLLGFSWKRGGGKSTLPKLKVLPFLQVDLSHHKKAVCILRRPCFGPGKTVHSEHTALKLAATWDHQADKHDSFFLNSQNAAGRLQTLGEALLL